MADVSRLLSRLAAAGLAALPFVGGAVPATLRERPGRIAARVGLDPGRRAVLARLWTEVARRVEPAELPIATEGCVAETCSAWLCDRLRDRATDPEVREVLA